MTFWCQLFLSTVWAPAFAHSSTMRAPWSVFLASLALCPWLVCYQLCSIYSNLLSSLLSILGLQTRPTTLANFQSCSIICKNKPPNQREPSIDDQAPSIKPNISWTDNDKKAYCLQKVKLTLMTTSSHYSPLLGVL